MFSKLEISSDEDMEFDLSELGFQDYFLIMDQDGISIQTDSAFYPVLKSFLLSDSLEISELLDEALPLKLTIELKEEIKKLIDQHRADYTN